MKIPLPNMESSNSGNMCLIEHKTRMSKSLQFLLKITLFPAKIETLERNLKFSVFSKQMMGYTMIVILAVALPNMLQAVLLGIFWSKDDILILLIFKNKLYSISFENISSDGTKDFVYKYLKNLNFVDLLTTFAINSFRKVLSKKIAYQVSNVI